MFKTNQNSELLPSKFSVGSTILADPRRWLVVGENHADHKYITLVDLANFCVIGSTEVEVQDLNHLTEAEVRKLVDSTIGYELNWTFSDFDFDSKGLKSV